MTIQQGRLTVGSYLADMDAKESARIDAYSKASMRQEFNARRPRDSRGRFLSVAQQRSSRVAMHIRTFLLALLFVLSPVAVAVTAMHGSDVVNATDMAGHKVIAFASVMQSLWNTRNAGKADMLVSPDWTLTTVANVAGFRNDMTISAGSVDECVTIGLALKARHIAESFDCNQKPI